MRIPHLTLLPVLAGCGHASHERAHPNVVLILVDTLRADAVGAYGSRHATTPNLDAVAASGMVWEQATSQAAWTVPSVASLFTGVDPQAHHCLRFDVHGAISLDTLSPAHDTLAEQFHASGYATAAFIKSTVLDASLGYDQGFGTYQIIDGDDRAWGHSARDLNDAAIPWLTAAEAGHEPFFAYLHYMDAHSPYHPPPPYDTRYDAAYDGPYDGAHMPVVEAVARGAPPGPRDWEHLRGLYDGEIAYWDSEFGRLYQALDAVGAWRDTVLVVVGDHGEAFFEHHDVFHEDVYQENVHVPLVMVGPGVPVGRMSGYTQLIDLPPTLVALTGVRPGSRWTGRSQLAGMAAGVAPGEEVYSEYEDKRSLIEPGGLKLLVGEGPDRLYDLAVDPGETRNLAASRPGDVTRLRDALDVRVASAQRLGRAFVAAPRHALNDKLVEELQNLGYLE